MVRENATLIPRAARIAGRLTTVGGTFLQPGLRRSSAISTIASGVVLVLNGATGAIAARELGPLGRGELAAIIVAPPLIAALAAEGCGPAVSFYHARHPSSGGTLISTWALLLLPVILLALGAGEIYAHLVSSAYGSATAYLAGLFGLTVICSCYLFLFSGVCLGAGDFGFYNAALVAQPVAMVVIYVLLAVSGTFNVATVTATYGGVVTAVCAAWAGRAIARFGLARPSLSLARSTVVYALKLQGASLGNAVKLRFDQFLLPLIVAASSLGLYAVAVSANAVVTGLAAALSIVVLPSVARRPDRALGMTRRALAMTLLIAVAVAGVLALLAQPLVELVYGQAFVSSAGALRLLLPGSVALAGATVMMGALAAVNRPLWATASELAAAGLTAGGLALVAVLHAGITGAAVVSSGAYTATFLLALFFFLRASGSGLRSFIAGRPTPGGQRRAEDGGRVDRGSPAGGPVSAGDPAAPSSQPSLTQLLAQRLRDAARLSLSAVAGWPVVGGAADALLDRLSTPPPVFPLHEVLRVTAALEAAGVPAWVGGGWGVDALWGAQTEVHADLDLFLDDFDECLPAVSDVLGRLGYRSRGLREGGIWTLPSCADFEAPQGYRVEVLGVNWPLLLSRASLAGSRSLPDTLRGELRRSCLAGGQLDQRPIPCLSAQAQTLFHTGYPPAPKDTAEIALLESITRPRPIPDPSDGSVTAVIVPVFDLDPRTWRVWKALNSGETLPPHLTLLFPFLAHGQITDPVMRRLEGVLAGHEPFDYQLSELAWFGRRVVYFSPAPAQPFAALIANLADDFSVLPYGGAHPSVVPHVTLGESMAPRRLKNAAARVRGRLPLRGRATEAWLVVEQAPGRWRLTARLPFGRRDPSGSVPR